MPTIRVFIAEASYPKDFYNRSLDGVSVENLLNTIRIENTCRLVLNEQYLKKAIKEAVEDQFDVFHLSCHGNDDGIAIGSDTSDMDWAEFASMFQTSSGALPYLVMSSCCGAASGVGKAFKECGKRPPIIFGSTESLGYSEYSVAWAILYHRFKKDGISKTTAMTALKQISAVVHDSFVYRRWDEDDKTYKKFPPSYTSFEISEVCEAE